MTEQAALKQAIEKFNSNFLGIESQISQVIVGMQDVVRGAVSAIFAGGHVLMEGVPGLGKTLLVKTITQSFGLAFKRIQFTPDLMPSDVTGTQVLTEDESGHRRFVFKPGPIFANIVLADEINRATPKTQAALLEAMEERQITVLDETYQLQEPFFVLATQNPIELEGTYPLPEAQLARFLVKLQVPPPSGAQLKEILTRTTGVRVAEIRPVFHPQRVSEEVAAMRRLVRQVVVPEPMMDMLVQVMEALTPQGDRATSTVRKYGRFGPGPRGAQAVLLLAKVKALLDGRINLSFDDLRTSLVPALRHRMILNFQAEADQITSDDLIAEVARQ